MTKGLGQQQQVMLKFTEAKIVSFLVYKSFNYEQLQKETHIQRNTLRTRLDTLVTRHVLIKHKYHGPKSANGGPRCGDIYYILNWSNPQASELIDYYYDHPELAALCSGGEQNIKRQKQVMELELKINQIKSELAANEKNLIVQRTSKRLVNIEYKIQAGYKKSLEMYCDMAENILELRKLKCYDDIPTGREKDNPSIINIKGGLVTDTVAQTIIKRMLQVGASDNEMKYIHDNLPAKYKQLTDYERSQRLKSLHGGQMQREEEFISNVISNVSNKHMEYLLVGAKRQIRYDTTGHETATQDEIKNVKSMAKDFADRKLSSYDMLILSSALNTASFVDTWQILKREGYLNK